MEEPQTGTAMAYLEEMAQHVERAAKLKREALRAAFEAVYGNGRVISLNDIERAEKAFDDVLLYGRRI